MPDVLQAVALGQVHVRVDDRGYPAALLARHDDLDAIALQDGDRALAEAPVVVIDPAAVEVRHLAPRFGGSGMSLEPSLEGQPLILWQRPAPVDPHEALHQHAKQRVAVPEVGKRGGHAAQLPEQSRSPEHPVAQGASRFTGTLVLGAPDVLLDADLRRAGHLAELAAGAEVEAGRDGGLLRRAKPFHVRTQRLGTPEDFGRPCDGTHSVARGALGAGLNRGVLFDRVRYGLELFGDHAASASCAARYPVAIAIPPRDLVPDGSYPAIAPPAQNTLRASGLPFSSAG